MEADLSRERQRERLRLFRAFDADGSGTVDAGEFERGLREHVGLELEEGMAQRLLRVHDEDNDGVLRFEEFNLTAIERTLEDLRQQDWEAELAERRQRRQERERLEARREADRLLKEYYAALPPANESTGLLTRIASVLVYLLPILDGLRFGIALSAFHPVVQSALHILTVGPLELMNSVPAGQLIIFCILHTLADRTELPVLLRYNMRQAVVLDVVLGLLQLAQVVAAILAFGEAPQDMAAQWESNILVFAALLGCVLYAAGKSLLGQLPSGIPHISKYTEKHLAPTRPSNWDERLHEDLPPSV